MRSFSWASGSLSLLVQLAFRRSRTARPGWRFSISGSGAQRLADVLRAFPDVLPPVAFRQAEAVELGEQSVRAVAVRVIQRGLVLLVVDVADPLKNIKGKM